MNMASKEIKARLKEIREAIKCEKYAEAIKECEDVLRDDPKNYMAFILLGAAYQNTDKNEAAKNLRKAVECSPAAPTVALQGLANCAPVEELPKIYEQLLDLVPEKYVDYYEKLYALSERTAVNEECFQIFKNEASKDADIARKQLALKYLAQIWIEKDYIVEANEEELYKSALEEAINRITQRDTHLNACKRYLKLLYKQKDLLSCIQNACHLIKQYPTEVFAYEWICKIYCENQNSTTNGAADWRTALQESIEYYADELLKLNENSSLGLLIKAINLHALEQFVPARDLLYRVQAIQPNYFVAVELLAQIEMKLGAFGLALPLLQQLDVQNEDYAVCLSYTNEKDKLQKAITLLESLQCNKRVSNALARCYYKLGERGKLMELSLDVLTKAEYLLSPTEAIALLQASADVAEFEALLLLGRLELQVTNYTTALTYLLKATKLKPYYADCFLYLGQLYYATNDLVRARKCYEKCINLNATCEEAVNNLSVIYQQIAEEDLNEALLLNTLKYIKGDSAKRLHYRLGLHYLSVNKCDNALQNFRLAIQIDAKCINYWESLGDAYAARGSYNSAIRVFQKILEMNAANKYAKLQIALIKTITRMYIEAIEDFDMLLSTEVDYLPALKGAAEAHLGLANDLKQEHRYARSKMHLQLAVDHLQGALSVSSNHEMVWLWRLLANAFLQTARMPTSLANLEVSGKLAKCEELAYLDRTDLLNLAQKFFTCALKIKQNTYLWYEMAVCAYYSAIYMPDEAETYLELATKASKMAIQAESSRWMNWNLLGVINMHKAINNLPLAQHCFIQALTLERKSYTTWTNLGALYVKLNEVLLANQAFQHAQQSSPIYANAWIGQAIIAEMINEEEEALDLFRHCQQFDYHAEAALGYAHWVCEILTQPEKYQKPHYKHAIENMYADVLALDAINRYVINEEEQSSLAALSFQGFLYQRQKLYRPALRAYLQAVKTASDDVERDKMYTNLGYLYIKLNQSLEAINAFNAIKNSTLKSIIGLALAYHHAGQYQESYTIYNSIIETENAGDKVATLLIAMSSIVYELQGEDDTKTVLLQCMLLNDYPVQVLLSALSLAILHDDHQLAVTVLGDIKEKARCEQYCVDIAYVVSQYYLANRQISKGLRYLSTILRMFPHKVELREELANYLLDNYDNYHVPTSRIGLSIVESLSRFKRRSNDCEKDAGTLLTASRALRPVDEQSCRKSVQRAIHFYPQNMHAWHMLLELH